VYWGAAKDAVRYCHFADDAERARWLADSGLSVSDRFAADGANERMNDYVVALRQG
jgi:hypothetical protein